MNAVKRETKTSEVFVMSNQQRDVSPVQLMPDQLIVCFVSDFDNIILLLCTAIVSWKIENKLLPICSDCYLNLKGQIK